ncbi:phage/plasmid replication domain-containing protein [Pseudomonas ficuserectae]|uniref:phage/plasmid replication domain-containing protein n=1 Tax=Pseudomonas ficuserectae TaxID=53410 RepID=UPI0035270976
MSFREVTRRLVDEGILSNTKSAYTTAVYYQLWIEGEDFDLSSRSVQTHRARLRRLGFDIARPYTPHV